MLIVPYSVVALIVAGSVALGYAIGRLDWIVARMYGIVPTYVPTTSVLPATNTLRAAMQESAPSKGKIEIDAGKYVGGINTEGMQKTQDIALGKTTKTDDDISSSVSKLAQLKAK